MESLKKLIHKLIKSAKKSLEKYSSKSVSFPTKFTFLHIVERLKDNLVSLTFLLSDTQMHEHAIGLICRNILTDFIVSGYMIKTSNNDSELEEKLFILHNDQLKRSRDFLQIYVNAGVISEKEMNNSLKYNSNSIENHIINTVTNNKNFPSQAKMIKELIGKNKNDSDPWINELISAYDIYTFFSKYEHIGWHSYSMTRHDTEESIIKRIKLTIKFACILLGSCFEMLDQKEFKEIIIKLIKQNYKT